MGFDIPQGRELDHLLLALCDCNAKFYIAFVSSPMRIKGAYAALYSHAAVQTFTYLLHSMS